MSYSRQDRINLHKETTGISNGEPTLNELEDGVPKLRSIVDNKTGETKTIQYLRNGLNIVESEFSNAITEPVFKAVVPYKGRWYRGREVDITDTGTHIGITVPKNTYVMDIRILVTEAITAGSMDIDVGISTNPDVFVDGWDGTAGSHALDTINAFGRGSSATETGVKVGKFFEDVEAVNVLVNTAAGAGKIRLLTLLVNNPIFST